MDSFCTSDIPITSITNVHKPITISIKAVTVYIEVVKNAFSNISTLRWNSLFPNSTTLRMNVKRTTNDGINAYDIILNSDLVFPTPLSHFPVQLIKAA